MRTQSRRSPFVWPLLLVVVGIFLLLNNYLLISLDILDYWPVILIFLGLQLLWRGDWALSWQAQTFGITRGTVETASLEINSGEIDVRVKALNRPGRLIAGQYTARSRPGLTVRNNRASIVMQRGATWLFSMADWEVGLAADLPWAVLMSAHLGQLEADLRNLEVSRAYVATGIGDIRLVCPREATGPVMARSTFGDVRLAVPEDVPAIIQIQAGPLCRVIRHSRLFRERASDHKIITAAYQAGAPAIEITLANTFGNIHLLSIPAD